MSETRPLVERLRKGSVCVYLAAEEGPAADLADMLTKAADQIEADAERIAQYEDQIQDLHARLGFRAHDQFPATASSSGEE